MYTAKTLDTLLEAMVSDLQDLFRNGLEVASLNFIRPAQAFNRTMVLYMYMQ